MRDISNHASIVSVWASLGRVWPHGYRQLVPWEHGQKRSQTGGPAMKLGERFNRTGEAPHPSVTTDSAIAERIGRFTEHHR